MRAGLPSTVKETLANGRPTYRGGISLLAEAARERGTTPDALALAAVVAQPWADIVTVEMLESNLAALGLQVEGELDARLAGLTEEPVAYWSERGALAWN